ncbi:integrase, catalytic region, zinc finger, CCHC-type containing protein [Tanacetum coccineum]
MEQFQVNTKFLNSLPPEWSKFVTGVKLVKDLHTSNFDQLHAYLKQHELHANEVRIMRERNQDPLAFVVNQQMTPPHFNPYQSSYNPQLQQQFSQSLYGSIQPNQQYSSLYPSQTQFNHSSIPPSHTYQSQMNHQTLTVPQMQGYSCNKFRETRAKNYSGTTYKSNATNSKENTTSGQARVVKCYNCQGEGHMARQCT